jgi:hypothetical protein
MSSSGLLRLVHLVNRAMIGFDLVLGAAAIGAPDLTLRVLGHERPSDDARSLFRRCGPIWLTFAAAHLRAATRGSAEDWRAVSWLRATEIATDPLWSGSPAVTRPGARAGLRLAGACNLVMTAGAAYAARQARASQPGV